MISPFVNIIAINEFNLALSHLIDYHQHLKQEHKGIYGEHFLDNLMGIGNQDLSVALPQALTQ